MKTKKPKPPAKLTTANKAGRDAILDIIKDACQFYGVSLQVKSFGTDERKKRVEVTMTYNGICGAITLNRLKGYNEVGVIRWYFETPEMSRSLIFSPDFVAICGGIESRRQCKSTWAIHWTALQISLNSAFRSIETGQATVPAKP